CEGGRPGHRGLPEIGWQDGGGRVRLFRDRFGLWLLYRSRKL
ncbi:uncharacterized protein METZ01_LOCUS488834, partial [marine metagenome]